MKENIHFLSVMMSMVALLGEWKITLFDDAFRFSLGAAAFFFFLLWNRRLSPLLLGVLNGVFVVLFRIGIDALFHGHDFVLIDAFFTHGPAFFYYVVFSILFSVFRSTRFLQIPLFIGLFGSIAEIVSNCSELFVRYLITEHVPSFKEMNVVVFVAFIRSFSVAGLFSFFQLREVRISREKSRQQNEKMVLFISELYEEALHFKYSLEHMKDINTSVNLMYKELKKKEEPVNPQPLAKNILGLTGKIHEIKNHHQKTFTPDLKDWSPKKRLRSL